MRRGARAWIVGTAVAFLTLAGVALAATLADKPPGARECIERSTRVLEAPRGPGEPGRFACVEWTTTVAEAGAISPDRAPWWWFGAGVVAVLGAVGVLVGRRPSGR